MRSVFGNLLAATALIPAFLLVLSGCFVGPGTVGPGGTGKVRRLLYEPAPDNSFPTKLSETGLFEDLDELTP